VTTLNTMFALQLGTGMELRRIPTRNRERLGILDQREYETGSKGDAPCSNNIYTKPRFWVCHGPATRNACILRMVVSAAEKISKIHMMTDSRPPTLRRKFNKYQGWTGTITHCCSESVIMETEGVERRTGAWMNSHYIGVRGHVPKNQSVDLRIQSLMTSSQCLERCRAARWCQKNQG
jgi:hypothetical protein